jgi:hypothetical protein
MRKELRQQTKLLDASRDILEREIEKTSPKYRFMNTEKIPSTKLMMMKLSYNFPKILLGISIITISFSLLMLIDFGIRTAGNHSEPFLSSKYILLLPFVNFASLLIIVAVQESRVYRNKKYNKLHRQASLLINRSYNLTKERNQNYE